MMVRSSALSLSNMGVATLDLLAADISPLFGVMLVSFFCCIQMCLFHMGWVKLAVLKTEARPTDKQKCLSQ